MPLTLKQHANGFWYVTGSVVVWRDGRSDTIEVRQSTKTRDRAQAEGIRRQIENAQAEQNITGQKPALTVSEAANRYVAQGGEARYVDKVKRELGHLPITKVTQQDMDDASFRAYPDHLPATRRRQFFAPAIAILRSAGHHANFNRPPDSQKQTLFFQPKQANDLIREVAASRWPNPWTPALVTFLFCQGSRVGETLAIDGKDDISLEGGYAILRDTKNGRERMVPLYRRTLAALSQVPNVGQRGPLFLRYDGRPYVERERRGYKLFAWSSAVKRIGMDPERYTPHKARHSWATWFYAQTKDVVRLKAEGGWESDEWERYVKLAHPSLAHDAVRYNFNFAKIPQNGGAARKQKTS